MCHGHMKTTVFPRFAEQTTAMKLLLISRLIDVTQDVSQRVADVPIVRLRHFAPVYAQDRIGRILNGKVCVAEKWLSRRDGGDLC